MNGKKRHAECFMIRLTGDWFDTLFDRNDALDGQCDNGGVLGKEIVKIRSIDSDQEVR